jgi:hypothetical protein
MPASRICKILMLALGSLFLFAPAAHAQLTMQDPPTIYLNNDDTYLGSTVQCMPAMWSEPGDDAYAWLRGGEVVDENQLHNLGAADIGQPLSCRHTRTSVSGSQSAESESIVTVAPEATSIPYVFYNSFTNYMGDTVQCMSGEWTGSGYEFTYQWLRDGQAIEGEVNALRVIKSEDIGHLLSCKVSLIADEQTVASAETSAFEALAPEAFFGPTIFFNSNDAYHGATVQCLAGVWTGSDYSFVYQWLRDGELIGDQHETYVLTAADIDHQISCRVSLVDSAFQVIAGQDAPAFTALAPMNVLAPMIFLNSNSTAHGSTIQCMSGAWTGSNYNYSYQWLRDGQPIDDAGVLYVIQPVDVGTNLTCRVSLIDANGVQIASADSDPLLAQPPVPTLDPYVFYNSGDTYHGATVQCMSGSWTGSGYGFAYQWLRNGQVIDDSALHVLDAADMDAQMGCRIRLMVGDVSIASFDTPTFTAQRPVWTTQPSVFLNSSHTYHGATIQCIPGAWTGSAYAYAFEWLRDGQPTGDTSAVHVINADDMEHDLSCRVSLMAGDDLLTSADSLTIPALVPIPTTDPYIFFNSASTELGSTVQCMPGEWTGSGYAYAYQWLRNGQVIVDTPDSPIYVLKIADRNATISCNVQLVADSVLTSKQTAAFVAGPLRRLEDSQLSGSMDPAGLGDQLSCTPSLWSPQPDEVRIIWLRDGAPFDNQSADPMSHQVEADDLGADVTCRSEAVFDAEVLDSDTSASISPVAPALSPAPEVIGETTYGNWLTCQSGDWSPGGPFVTGYSWLRDGQPISESTSQHLTDANDAGHSFTCEATAIYAGSSVASMPSTNFLAIQVPAAIVDPAISGEAIVGDLLSCGGDGWTGLGTTTVLSYSWLRDNQHIDGADSATYTISSEDKGHQLTCRVTAGDQLIVINFDSADSAPLAIPGPVAPSADKPTVTGTPHEGQLLTCESALWSGDEPITLTYSWKVGEQVQDETTDLLLVTANMQGLMVTCSVTGENVAGKLTVESDPVGPVSVDRQPVAPDIDAPTIEGEPVVGNQLTCTSGEILAGDEPIELGYAWFTDHGIIEGAQETTYTLTDDEVDSMITCQVTATNDAGQDSEVSAPAGPVSAPPAAPDISKPIIIGDPAVGALLTCVPGDVFADESEFVLTYAWFVNGQPAQGEGNQYLVAVGDAGSEVTCQLTAANDIGSDAEMSDPVSIRIPLTAPAVESPYIEGALVPGATLTCMPGQITGSQPLEITYAWYRGESFAGNAATYTALDTDVAQQLTCRISASNEAGQDSADSAPVTISRAPVPPAVPKPAVVGELIVGAELTCRVGEITGDQPLTITYSWLLDGKTRATGQTYQLAAADQGAMVACEVAARNDAGRALASSDPRGPVAGLTPAPVLAGDVSITGKPTPGQMLTCVPGTWTGDALLSYEWLLDGTVISGASGVQLAVESSHVGHRLSCRVTGTSGLQSVSADSARLLVFASATTPEPKGPCTILGTPQRDLLIGTPGDDVICALAANDVIYGGGGNDRIYAGTGNDIVRAGAGNDRVWGQGGSDSIWGEAGADSVLAASGADFVAGGTGNDKIDGGAGSDRLRGDSGNDQVIGGTGNDHVSGNGGADRVSGGWRLDPMPGSGAGAVAQLLANMRIGDGSDVVEGGAGPDLVQGGTGSDYVYAGAGDDTIYGGAGSDRLYGEAGYDTFYRSPGCDRWYGEREIIAPQWARIGCSGVFAGV